MYPTEDSRKFVLHEKKPFYSRMPISGMFLSSISGLCLKEIPSEQTLSPILSSLEYTYVSSLLTKSPLESLSYWQAFYFCSVDLHGKLMKERYKDRSKERCHFSHPELHNSNQSKMEKVRNENLMEGPSKSSWENKCTEGTFLYRSIHILPRHSD